MRSKRERKHARERGLAHEQNHQVAESPCTTPTTHPERGDLAAYMREREVVRARALVISEKIVS